LDQKLIPALFMSLFLGWAIYRRARRLIGRQPVQVGRLRLRLGIFAALGTLGILASLRDPMLLAAVAGGLLGGAALGAFGLQQTQFEVTPEGRFYTPHTYVGLFVTALFLARIAYRLLSVYMRAPDTASAPPNLMGAGYGSPLTLAIFGTLLGYYLTFYSGVLRKSRQLHPI